MITRKEAVCYGTDASRLIGKTDKVVFPENINEVQEIVKSSLDIVPRGAGSSLVGGCIPGNSVVIDMSKMNKVYNFNSGKRNVNVEAGVTLRELNEKLKAKGFEFPIQLSNEGISTIGGMIATNASGKRSLKYGAMRDWVEEIEVVNGRGELVRISRADLMDVCGMEGITGIIVSARIKIMPLLKRSASIFQSDNIDDILSVARRLKIEPDVCSLELFSSSVSSFFGFPEKYNLFVEFDSDRGKIKYKEYDEMSRKLDRIYYSLASKGYYIDEDPKFFFDKIKEFISVLEGYKAPFISYLGSGVIHCFFKDEEKNKKDEIMNYLKKAKVKFAKYGIGLKRKAFLEPFEVKIIQRTKSRHDPFGKINKGKMIDGYYSIEKREEVKEELKIKQEKKIDEGKKPFKEEINLIKEINPMQEIGLIKDIEPLEGEEKSAVEAVKEMDFSKEKTPEEKIQDFIKEEEEREQEQISVLVEEIVHEKLEKTKTSVDYNEIRNIMNNNLDTGKSIKPSFLGDEQNFALSSFSCPKNSNDKLIPLSEDKTQGVFGKNKEEAKTSKDNSDEMDLIKRIMTNKYNADAKKEENNKNGSGNP